MMKRFTRAEPLALPASARHGDSSMDVAFRMPSTSVPFAGAPTGIVDVIVEVVTSAERDVTVRTITTREMAPRTSKAGGSQGTSSSPVE